MPQMPRSKSMANFAVACAQQFSGREAILYKDEYRTHRYTYQAIYDLACKCIGYFESHGIKAGDKILVCAPNSPEWVVVYFAGMLSGVVLVPIDFQSEVDFLKSVYEKTEAKHIFISRYKPISFSAEMTCLEDLFLLLRSQLPGQINKDLTVQSILEIVYTSGTTSAPKGVVLTHGNVLANLGALKQIMSPKVGDCFLSTLPLSHMLEQTLGLCFPLRFGGKIIYTSTRKSRVLTEVMQTEKVKYIVTVPAFLEVFQQKITSGWQDRCQKTKYLAWFNVYPVFKKYLLRRQLPWCHTLKHFIVGGAPLARITESFWNDLDVRVLQGYGLTETAPIITCNANQNFKPFTVGKVLPGQDLKIMPDKEIYTRGANVFGGYYDDMKATNATFDRDWFKTGDLGEIDDEGFLRLVGRKKNMILTSSGLNVYPEDIESVLKLDSMIKDATVFGWKSDEKTEIVAAITTDSGSLTLDEFKKSLNQKLASSQQIDQLLLYPALDFPRTPSHKVKRREVEVVMKSQIESGLENIVDENVSDNLLIVFLKNWLEKSSITENDNLYNDLKIDSIQRVELVSLLEEKFDIELEESLINDRTTVLDLEKIVESAQKNNQHKTGWGFWSFAWWCAPVRILLQGFSFLVLRFWVRIEVVGRDNLNNIDGPVVFALNHTSHLDSPVLLRALPFSMRHKVAFAARADYFFTEGDDKISFAKRLLMPILRLWLNIFPLSQKKSVRKSLSLLGAVLDRGFHVALYPEGTRTTTGKMNSFQSGIGLIAQEMKVTVVPVYLGGLNLILPKGQKFLRRGKSRVIFGVPQQIQPRESYVSFAQSLQNVVEKLNNKNIHE